MLCCFTKMKRETDDENEAEIGLLERGKVWEMMPDAKPS